MSARPLLLRLLAHCHTDAEVPVLQQALMQALPGLHAQPYGQPERYWKMPERVEFCFRLEQATLRAVVALCPSGWTPGGDEDDPSWVWNAGGDRPFVHPAVRWAELLRAPAADAAA